MASENFFGKRDAGQEDLDRLAQYFYRLSLFDRLKTGKKAEGACVVVGVKGSGKTAICRMIEKEHSASGIGWRLDLPDGFSVEDEKKRSSYYQSLLTVYLLSKMTHSIGKRKQEFSSSAVKALPSAIDNLLATAQAVLKKAKFSVGTDGLGLELDVGGLLKEGQSSLSQLTPDRFREILSPCLSEKQGYILIDDVDEIFPGSDTNFEFLEGLIAAAVEINNAFGSLLHCLVFVKAGAYSRYFERGRNYDKYGEEAAIILSWGPQELTDMMAARARVATGLGTAEEEFWKSLKWVFDGNKKDVLEIMQYMLDRSNSGPRDLIIFGNLAKQAAGDRKITLKDVMAQENRYSQEKLFLLNRDYLMQYGDVSNLLAKVFRHMPAIYSKGEFEKLIQTRILGNAEVMQEEFKSMPLLRSHDAGRIMNTLFDFGFIGFRDDSGSQFLYMMDMQRNLVAPGARLFSAYEHRIHPAYEAYLMLTPPNQ